MSYVECEKCLINSDILEIKKINDKYYCEECLEMMKNNTTNSELEEQWNEYVRKLKIRKKKSKYDVLFAFSGGKDSVAALYLTIEKYGLKPLVFTVDHGFKSPLILENCKTVIDYYKLDWIVTQVDKSIIQEIKNRAKVGDLPCVDCNRMWKASYFREIVELTGIDVVFTGGDTLVNGKFIVDKPEWSSQSVVFPLAVNFYNEKQIYDLAYSLGWKNPLIKGWDTDCTAVGVSLYNYRNKNGTYHVEELKHLAHRVRHGILDKEEARKMLMEEMTVSQEILNQF